MSTEIVITIKNTMYPLSIILVFIMMFNSMVINEFREKKSLETHPGPTKRKKRLQLIKNYRNYKIILILILNLISLYIYLPLYIKIIRKTKLILWNFNIIITAFVFIEILLLLLAIVQLYLLFSINKQMKKI